MGADGWVGVVFFSVAKSKTVLNPRIVPKKVGPPRVGQWVCANPPVPTIRPEEYGCEGNFLFLKKRSFMNVM